MSSASGALPFSKKFTFFSLIQEFFSSNRLKGTLFSSLEKPNQTYIEQPKYNSVTRTEEEKSPFYTVRFLPGENSDSFVKNMPATITVSQGTSVQIPTVIPTQKGYEFTFWENKETKEKYRPGSILSNLSSHMTLVAHWEDLRHKIAFHSNDTDQAPANNMPISLTVLDSTPALLSTIIPTRQGHKFVHWLDENSGVIHAPGDQLSTVTKGLDFMAIWEPLAVEEFLVSFEPNDSVEFPASNIPAGLTVSAGSSALIPSEVPVRTSYQFLNWFEPETGNEYNPGSTIPQINKNIVLYAQWQSVTLTASFYPNDVGGPTASNLPSTIVFHYGENIEIPDNIPTRTGYIFMGWSSTELGNTFSPGTVIETLTQEISLTATWLPVSEKARLITYEANDNETAPAENVPLQVSVDEFSSYTIPITIPTREGYAFMSWLEENSGETYTPGDYIPTVDNDLNFKAQWETTLQTRYALIYLSNDTSGPPAQNMPPNIYFYSGENVTVSTVIPTREGYTFLAWYWVNAGRIVNPGQTLINPNTNVFLNALWQRTPVTTYRVSFFPNDSEGPPAQNLPANFTVQSGATATIPTTIPTRTGYTFFGWSNPSTGATYFPGDTIPNVMRDINLYAIWQRASVNFTVTFLANDSGGPPAQNIPSPITVTEGSSVTIPATAPTRTGFTFVEWNTEADGTGTGYQPGDTIQNLSSNISLYAIWTQNPIEYFTIRFLPNDTGGPFATNIPSPIQVQAGGSATIPGTIPQRAGYEFVEWNTQADGNGTAYQPFDTISNVTSNINLYAIWRLVSPTVTVTFQPNDSAQYPAGNIPSPITVAEGSNVTIPDTIPVRPAFRFVSWNTQRDGSGTSYLPGDTIEGLTQDLTLFAQWESLDNQVTVTFEANDGGGPPAHNIPSPITTAVGGSVTIPVTIPTRQGYQFITWNTSPDGSGTAYQPGATISNITQNLTLYAIWRPYQPTQQVIVFYPNDECGPPACNMPSTVYVCDGGDTLIPDIEPLRDCFVFEGWNTSPDGSGRWYQPGEPVLNLTKNLFLYAIWCPLPPCELTVMFDANDECGPPARYIPCAKQVFYQDGLLIPDVTPLRKGYVFVEWSTCVNCLDRLYEPGDYICDITDDMVLFAIWEKENCPPPCPPCYPTRKNTSCRWRR